MTCQKTIFCDIDGTILQFEEYLPNVVKKSLTSCKEIPGSAEKCSEWHSSGNIIILVTGRPESIREITEFQLQKAGIIYDKLIMGCGCGPRFIINDNDCSAIKIPRNKGISSLTL